VFAPVSLQLTSQLKPFFGLLVPAFVLGFFLVTLLAIALSDNRRIRRSYIGGFFVLLIVVNLFSPITPAPLMKWHKFSEVRGMEKTEYAFRVVDTNGAELKYDDEATLNTGSVALSYVRLKMQNELTPAQRADTAQWLLDRATVHRERQMKRSPVRFLHFPRHAMADEWTPKKLAGYSEFTAVRLYRIDYTLSYDGTAVTSYNETLLYEYHQDYGTIHEIAESDIVDVAGDDDARLTLPIRFSAVPRGGRFA
jgi:hypothetical protein